MTAERNTWHDEFRMAPDDLRSLRFLDFPGGGIEDVAAHLYRTEPEFMAALEADVRERGVRQPVELGARDTIQDGTHRVTAAYRTGQPVPVAFYGETYPKDRAEEARWDAIRRAHPAEHAARADHIPRAWERRPGQAEPEFEAGS